MYVDKNTMNTVESSKGLSTNYFDGARTGRQSIIGDDISAGTEDKGKHLILHSISTNGPSILRLFQSSA